METRRQLLHVAVGGFAFLLRELTWPQALLLAAAAIAFNVFALPRLSPGVFRTSDRSRPWTSGIVLYPIAVMGLLLVFPARLDLAATAWVILAAGDGMATLVGAHARTPRLSWNHDKSVSGLVAFIGFGSAAAIAMTWWWSPTTPAGWMFVVPVAAAMIAAFAETVPIKLDDNITVPAVAAAVLWSAAATSPELAANHVGTLGTATWTWLGLNAAVAVLGWMARTVTVAGAITGAVIGALMIVGADAAGWILIIATFLMASLATRLGHARKTRAGIAEQREGRRGAGNAIANTGLAAWAALVSAGSPDPTLPHLGLVAALVTAGSDTVASEVGKAYGRTTWLVTSFRRVPPGTTGAVSLAGMIAGIASATVLAATAAWLGLTPAAAIPIVATAATVASLLEGVLGATLEARGMLTNDVVNFVNSAIGAGLALLAWSSL